jgi:hypothetical protein
MSIFLAQFLRRAIAVKIAFKPFASRVVRVGSQLLFTDGSQCFQCFFVIFHSPSMRRSGAQGIAQVAGDYA